MGNIAWQQSYSVGVERIDLQHQKLFSILNTLYDELHDKSNDKATVPIVENTLRDLKVYAEFHFGEEEKFFKEFQYERTAEHTAQHRFYEEKIEEFHTRYLLTFSTYLNEKRATFISRSSFPQKPFSPYQQYGSRIFAVQNFA